MRMIPILVFSACCFCGNASADDNRSYLEFSLVSRQHNYDFDVTFDGTQIKVDESFGAGYRLSAGWSFDSRWDIFLDYERHDNDQSDGVIIESGNAVRASITYKFFRAQVGIRNHLPLTDHLWLDTSVAYQKVRQGIGNFFISNGVLAFGLDSSKRDKGWNGELGLRLSNGKWQYRAAAGYDPHAGFEISPDGIEVESSAYGVLGIDYKFAENWTTGIELSHGKVTDASLAIRFLF